MFPRCLSSICFSGVAIGLGEMMPAQLWETTMDPERRLLKQLKVEDAAEANVVFSSLMGTRVSNRRFMGVPLKIEFAHLVLIRVFHFSR